MESISISGDRVHYMGTMELCGQHVILNSDQLFGLGTYKYRKSFCI
jgi:hypothetical protein